MANETERLSSEVYIAKLMGQRDQLLAIVFELLVALKAYHRHDLSVDLEVLANSAIAKAEAWGEAKR